MRRDIVCIFCLVVLLFLPSVVPAQAPAAGQTAPANAQAPAGAARGGRGGPALPANQPSGPLSEPRHQSFVEIAKKGNIDILFVGDSITDWWFYSRRGQSSSTGEASWNEHIAPLKPANFGIAGDTTQGVLWRMQNGELEGFKARLIVHMLGTNNINRNPVDEIVDGNRLIIEEYKKRQPQAKVLLLGVFPRGAEATNPFRATIKEMNGKLAKLADNKQVFFMDIGDKFLTADGTLTQEIMPDGLHPSARGYQIWAEAIMPTVRKLMQ